MQQDNNDIENKLRQLENQQLPDLSAMDAHWNAMQQIMPSAAPVAKTTITKNWWWLIGAACAVVAILVLLNNNAKKESTSVTKNVKPVVEEKTNNTSAIIITANDTVKTTLSKAIIKRITTVTYKMPDDIFVQVNDTTPVLAPVNNAPVNDRSTLSKEQNIALLNNFIASMQKKANVFTIDNKKDTVLKATDGSSVFIPAHAFAVADSVLFEIKEFYSYADMIASGLTTMADDKQLITGGMIYLSAKVKGKDVAVNPGKEIRVFIPNLTAKDSMQVFDGVQYGSQQTMDTIAGNIATQNSVNWKLSKLRIDSPVFKMFIRAIDLRDENIEYTVNYKGKTKAVFHRAIESAYSKEELLVLLNKKYGDYYDKIRVRKQWEKNLFFQRKLDMEEEYYQVAYNSFGVGDTALLLPFTVTINKLTPIDTMYRIVRWVNKGYTTVNRPVFPPATLSLIGEKYSIGIDKLGWINCDRFYGSPEPKTDFVVDLKDSSFKYVTYMVFDKFKSIMRGGEMGKQVIFQNIPIGQPVKIISFGIMDGQTVASVKSTVTSTNMFAGMQFEPMSATALKASLSQLDQ